LSAKHYYPSLQEFLAILNWLPGHTLSSYFSKVYFYIIFLAPMSSKWFPAFRLFTHQNPITQNYNFASCVVWV